ncbi:MAG: efflux RND transporter periplasmic adaptor subunit [Rhodovulum sp.]|nr:efflux RND transporter periplasmic adaptor subunit [Rhodovulum sp.]
MITRILRYAILLAVLAGLAGGGLLLLGRSDGRTPPKAGHAEEEGHGGGDKVEIGAAKLAATGIEIADAAPGVLRDSLLLNGIIQPNQETLVQITPRFPGVVRDIRKRIGDTVSKGDLLATVESNQSLTTYELKAPINGTIIDRQASLGEYASEQKAAFIVADLSTVWVDFSVYRRDFSRVKVGDTVIVDPEDGGSPIETKIAYVSPIGTSDTQSALARAIVPNKDIRLRPGLFVTGRLLLSAKPVDVAVKASALQTLENRTVVFVRNGELFEAREVEIGDRDAEQVEVLFGLMPGERYAAKNSFVIKAEIAKGAASHEH